MNIFILIICILVKCCQSTFLLQILHNNDMHARFEQTCDEKYANNSKCFGGFARIANVVRDARRKSLIENGPAVLYLNAGDTFTGTIWFAVHKWKIAADFINILKPDAVSLGNHEFDNKVNGLVPFVANLECPILAANLNFSKEPDLAKEKNLMKSHIFTLRGIKIGVIGYLTSETKTLASPNGIVFEDEVVSIRYEVNKLQREGVKILIALGHSGYEIDKRIARDVEGIDLIVGGHSHTFLWSGETPDIDESRGPYPTIIKQQSGRKVLVVQVYAFTKYIGRINIKFDSNGEILSFDGEPILLNNNIPQDSDVLALLEKYRYDILALKDQIIGTTKLLLDGSVSNCRIKECELGNFLADAMVFTYKYTYNKTDASMSMLHSGGVRSSIIASDGNISKSDLLAALPYQDPIVAVNISGRYIKEALENSVYKYDLIERPGAFLQLSGLIVKYDLKKSPGSRVVSVKARCASCNVPEYFSVEDNNYYKILMPIFMFKGGERYSMFKNKGVSHEVLNFSDVESVVTYIQYENSDYMRVYGRITIIDKWDRSGVKHVSSNPFSLIILMIIAVIMNSL